MSKIFLGDTLISGSVPATAAGSFSAGDPMVLTDSGEVRSATDAFSQLATGEKFRLGAESSTEPKASGNNIYAFNIQTTIGSFPNGNFYVTRQRGNTIDSVKRVDFFVLDSKDLSVLDHVITDPNELVYNFTSGKLSDGSTFFTYGELGDITYAQTFNGPLRYVNNQGHEYGLDSEERLLSQFSGMLQSGGFESDDTLPVGYQPIDMGVDSNGFQYVLFSNKYDPSSTAFDFEVYKFKDGIVSTVEIAQLEVDGTPIELNNHFPAIARYEEAGEQKVIFYMFMNGPGGEATSEAQGTTWKIRVFDLFDSGFGTKYADLRPVKYAFNYPMIHDDPGNPNNTKFHLLHGNPAYLYEIDFFNPAATIKKNQIFDFSYYAGASDMAPSFIPFGDNLMAAIGVASPTPGVTNGVVKIIDYKQNPGVIEAEYNFLNNNVADNSTVYGGDATNYPAQIASNNKDEILISVFSNTYFAKLSPNLNFVGFAENSGTTGDDVTIAQPEQITEAVTGFNQGDEIRMRWDGTLSTEAGVPVGEVLANGKVKILEGQW